MILSPFLFLKREFVSFLVLLMLVPLLVLGGCKSNEDNVGNDGKTNEPIIEQDLDIPISTSQDTQFYSQLTTDGKDGAIIVWEDNRSGSTEIYAQRLDNTSTVQWEADGIPISSMPALYKMTAQIVSDGSGGAIVAWMESRGNSYNNLVVQRVNDNGVIQWATDGIDVGLIQYSAEPKLLADGVGGAFIVWAYPTGISESDIYAQRLDSGGAKMWGSGGVAISAQLGNQSRPRIVSDGGSGAIIVWIDSSEVAFDSIYAQKVDGSGVHQWLSNGVKINSGEIQQQDVKAVSDGIGGIILTWAEYSNSVYRIFAQRIDNSGLIQWPIDGVVVSDDPGYKYGPMPVSDGAGGVVVVWNDYRNGNEIDIYAQRVDGAGIGLWTAGGLPVVNFAGTQHLDNIISDNEGGAILVWVDPDAYGIYAQRVDSVGVNQWAEYGVPISDQKNIFQNMCRLIVDSTGNLIVVWTDNRNNNYDGNSDIYARKISADGQRL